MDKLQKLVDRLQTSIDFATEQKEDFEASSWNYQEGVLLNHNEAKLVVELVKKLTIPVVVGGYENKPYDKLCKLRKEKIKDLKILDQVMKYACAGVDRYTGTDDNYKP